MICKLNKIYKIYNMYMICIICVLLYVLLYKEELIKLLNVCYYMCVIICVHSYRFFFSTISFI